MFFLVINSTFLIYLYALYPTISPYRDSGDMIVSAAALGIAHPPGYPLYVLSGKIFTLLIPFGNTAYRLNLMSAFFGALTCGVLYLLVDKIIGQIFGGRKLIRNFSSLAVVIQFCFSSSVHSLSIVSEMYSLNAFFAVLIIYLIVGGSNLLPAAFLFGLGLGNHQTLILLLPGITYLLIKKFRKNLLPAASYLLPVFLLGFSVYLFLPVRSAQKPVADWGEPSASVRNFVRVLTRADYGGMRLHPEKSPAAQNLSTVMKNLVNFLKVSTEDISGKMSVAFIPVILLGAYLSIRGKFFWAMFLFWFFSGPAFFVVSNLPLSDKTSLPILEPYLIMPLSIFAAWLGLAVYYIGSLVNEKAAAVLLFAAALVTVVVRLPLSSKRYEFIAYDYSKDLLKTLPENSVLFNPDDTTTFTVRYQQDCLNNRRDVKPAVFYRTMWGYSQLKKNHPDILPDYEIKSGMELEKTLLSYNFRRLPFFSDNISKIPPEYKIMPKGLLYGNFVASLSSSEKMFDFYILPARTTGENRFFTNQIINYYSAGYNNLGLAFNGENLYDKSIPLFEKAISLEPSLSQAYNNLGVVYWGKKDYGKSADYFSEALKYAPGDEGVRRNLAMAQEKNKK